MVTTLLKDTRELTNFIAGHPKLIVLTGAGVSCDSGIPTYRDQRGDWRHQTPIQEKAFLEDQNMQRRYWARSRYGWPIIRDALPNPAHVALAELEARGHIDLLITQNVDGLHQKAGSKNVIDLHGRVDRVCCLSCGTLYGREDVQSLLDSTNAWPVEIPQTPRPDGDMDVPDDFLTELVLPECPDCFGQMKPDVVFFGGSVPKAKVQTCLDAVEQADALLVVGSSLMVYSGYRFCRHSRKLEKPIAIVNPGVTRADDFAHLKLVSLASPLLTQVTEQLSRFSGPDSSGHDNPS